jgi:sulfoacetaldehyde acetyltransferase
MLLVSNVPAKLLAEARFPVIVAGGGVIMSDGQAEAKALAEYLSAPVVTSYLHNDAFPASHPLMCGSLGYQGSKAAMKLIAQADVVLALGTRLGPFGTLPQHGIEYWPKNAKIIQVDSDHRMLGLVKPITVGVCGDAKPAAADMLHRLQTGNVKIAAHGNKDARLAELKKQQAAWEAELNTWGQADGSPIAPRRALRELEKAMPKNAMVTTDIGNICSVSNSYLRFEQPRSFFAAMSFGNCGYAFPTAIGAKVGAPDRPAIAYVGDGAWGMSLQETLTCVREDIPVVAVVFNNGQWGAEKKNQIDFYADRFVGTNLKNPSFAGIAKAMGAEGITVGHPGEVGDALRTAVASNKPTVLELMVTQELGDPFRRDALKKPVRALDKYKAYTVA